MSDLLSRAAEAMGIPEPLAERSARARAEASGQSYEDVLTAWAGGQAVAAAPEEPSGAPAPEPEEPQPEEAREAAAEPAPPAEPAQPAPAAPAPEPVPAGATAPARPPVLDAPPDRPLVTVAGGVAVLILTMLLGFVLPALPAETEEIRTSRIAYPEAAERGRHAYLEAGCASCHTQSVRAVVADVGLGPVTLPDTNQVPGYRRIGPDLSNVGGRLSPDQIASVLSGGSHPATPLSQGDMEALVTYLNESVYMEGDES